MQCFRVRQRPVGERICNFTPVTGLLKVLFGFHFYSYVSSSGNFIREKRGTKRIGGTQ